MNEITKPKHYQLRKSCNEVRDVIRDRTVGMFASGYSAELAYDYENSIKYLLRWWGKDGIKDLKKAKYTIESMIELLESNHSVCPTSKMDQEVEELSIVHYDTWVDADVDQLTKSNISRS